MRQFYIEAGLDPDMEEQDQIEDGIQIIDDSDIQMRDSVAKRDDNVFYQSNSINGYDIQELQNEERIFDDQEEQQYNQMNRQVTA